MRSFVVFMLVFFTSFLYGATYTVNNISDLANTLTYRVNDGDTIYLRPSGDPEAWTAKHYKELISINKSVTIQGLGSSPYDIRISASWIISLASTLVEVNANNVTFKNFTIDTEIIPMRLNGYGTYEFYDMRIYKSINVGTVLKSNNKSEKIIIKDSEIVSTTTSFAAELKTNHLIVDHSTIKATSLDKITGIMSYEGLRVNGYSKKITIKNNSHLQGRNGLYVENCDDIYIGRTTVKGGISGIYINQSRRTRIVNSESEVQFGGIYYSAITAAIDVQQAQELKILGCTIKGVIGGGAGLGTRAILIGKGVNKVFMNYDCIYGGYYGIGISRDGLTKYIVIKNSKIKDYVLQGFWYDYNTNIKLNNSCLYGNKVIGNSVASDSNLTENFWENAGEQNMYDIYHHLDKCPLSNDCKLKPKFDAWNTFSDMDDRNISTKISNDTYNLTLTALDEAAGKYEDLFKGTLCARIVDEDNNSLSSGWKKEYLNQQNDINMSFTVPKASKNARVQLNWENDVNQGCPVENDKSLTDLSTDNFAIRPKKYDILDPNSKRISSVPFNLNFYGRDNLNNETINYNERLNDTFLVDWTEIDTTRCEDGEVSNDTNWSFSNGYKEAPYKQNKQGVFEVAIGDENLECSDRFASVDCKDKNVSGKFNTNTTTSIETATKRVSLTCKRAFGFDAYDTFRDGQNDRNISTKVANSTFELKISPYKENHYDFQEFNGTACVRLIDDDENSLTDWQQLIYKDDTVKTVSLPKEPKASKKTRVQIEWKKRVTESCPLIDDKDKNATASTDEFAIRPKNFDISAPNRVKAGRKFNLSFYGMDDSNKSTQDYNETVNTTFKVSYKDRNTSCVTGSFDTNITTNWDFEDGYKKFNLAYNEVGALDIGISDLGLKCSDLYASVDCKDGNISGKWNTSTDIPIGEYNTTILFTLDHFDINASLEDYTAYNSITSLDENFTYLSDLNTSKDMYSILKLNAIAKSAEGNTTQNYANGCYAEDGIISVKYKATYRTSDETVDGANLSPDGNISYLQYSDMSAVSSDEPNSTKLGESMKLAVSKELFANGIVDIPIKVNFDRDYSKPVSPFKLSISDVGIKDASGVEDGKSSTSGSANFYYGRVRPTNVLTTVKDFDEFIEYEVYDTNKVHSSWLQNSLFWYRNRLENGSNTLAFGHTIDMTESTYNGTLPGNKLSNLSKKDLQSINIGRQAAKMKLNIGANVNQLDMTVHLQTQPWLWFTNAQNPKSYSDTGSCQRHPCFDISYMNADGTLESGEFKGSDVNITNTVKKSIQHGVKVFR